MEIGIHDVEISAVVVKKTERWKTPAALAWLLAQLPALLPLQQPSQQHHLPDLHPHLHLTNSTAFCCFGWTVQGPCTNTPGMNHPTSCIAQEPGFDLVLEPPKPMRFSAQNHRLHEEDKL